MEETSLPPLPFLILLSETCAKELTPCGEAGLQNGSQSLGDDTLWLVSGGHSSSLRRVICSLLFSSLESCDLTTVCCLNISKALVRSQSLRFLNLSTSHLLDDGIKLLCEALGHPKCYLERLSLSLVDLFFVESFCAVLCGLVRS